MIKKLQKLALLLIHKETKRKNQKSGGYKTNINGLAFEKLTDLSNHIKVQNKIRLGKRKNDWFQNVIVNNTKLIKVEKSGLVSYMRSIEEYIEKERKLYPDECFINTELKKLFIIEKKYQSTRGSADEKIQTAIFKKFFYEEQYPNFVINYCYCLNNWFLQEKYHPEMRFLKSHNIPVFFGESKNYINFISKYISY